MGCFPESIHHHRPGEVATWGRDQIYPDGFIIELYEYTVYTMYTLRFNLKPLLRSGEVPSQTGSLLRDAERLSWYRGSEGSWDILCSSSSEDPKITSTQSRVMAHCRKTVLAWCCDMLSYMLWYVLPAFCTRSPCLRLSSLSSSFASKFASMWFKGKQHITVHAWEKCY